LDDTREKVGRLRRQYRALAESRAPIESRMAYSRSGLATNVTIPKPYPSIAIRASNPPLAPLQLSSGTDSPVPRPAAPAGPPPIDYRRAAHYDYGLCEARRRVRCPR